MDSHRLALERLLAERADQPLGDTELASGRTLQPFSIAGQRAAANLLTKADRALEDGDPERARSFVDRAARLSYDEHEKAHPAAMAAEMALFGLITDTLEDGASDDSRWLSAAIEVLSQADDPGRWVLRDVLTAIDKDYDLSREERRRVRAAIEPVAASVELRDLRLEPHELSDRVSSVLAVLRAYRAASRRIDSPDPGSGGPGTRT
jgi:hypothetical protein